MLCWLASTHKHLSIFCGIRIGVKCDTLYFIVGHSPAGAGLYGLLGRRRRRRDVGGAEKRKSRICERERTILFVGVAERREKPYVAGHLSASLSHSAMCHVDIAKLNSFYWAQFLA